VTIRSISIQARWDGDAHVWTGTSDDVPGLVVEANTWTKMIEETEIVLPDLLSLSGGDESKFVLTFKDSTPPTPC
jgi:Domain of unknown function (DUF1902)